MKTCLPTLLAEGVPILFLSIVRKLPRVRMAGSHVGFTRLDVNKEQADIDQLIELLTNYKPNIRKNQETSDSSPRVVSTPKSTAIATATRRGPGRPPKSKSVDSSGSPLLKLNQGEENPALELIINCLEKLNQQNKSLLNHMSELNTLVENQNKEINDLRLQISSQDKPPSENTVPTVSSSLVNKVVERVEVIETRLNDRLLLCRGPEVTTKIAAASGDGSPNLGMLKADICASICGDKVNEISVNSVGFSLFGKDRNLLKIECTDSNTKDFILKQARSLPTSCKFLIRLSNCKENILVK